MNKSRLILYVLGGVACLDAIILILQNSTIVVKVCAVIMALLGILIVFFTRKFNMEATEKITRLTKEFRSENEALSAKLDKSEDIRARFRAALEDMEHQLEECKNGGTNSEPDLNTSETYLKGFNENYVQPFLAYLRSIEMPITDNDRQKTIDATINIAMLAIDIADCYDWTINNRNEQRINCALATKDITPEEASRLAIQITDNPELTPRWIRALSTTLSPVISKDSGIILSGYKA